MEGETTVIENYYYEVINSNQVDRLITLTEETNTKLDLFNTNISGLTNIVQDNLNYVMLIFFVLSIFAGVYIGYLLGRKK